MGNFDPLFFPLPPRLWFRKGSTQGSYFEAISGVFPYPNGSCKKIGFHIELQINAIGIGWFLLALPPKNRTCEFPRIRLKWRRFAHPLAGREERILRAWSTPWQQEKKGDLVLYSGDLFPTEARKPPSCPRSHSVNRKGKPTHPSAPLVDRCGFTKRLSTVHSR
ncbi:unnamed protein product [Vicia faba]|uniref:Uncharacterized protein n=1 Tax=Vicia faba TaxID=3906 RepID=A0AAV0Z6I0_VICFA|nr:unnamed protein product [Vicia faba]